MAASTQLKPSPEFQLSTSASRASLSTLVPHPRRFPNSELSTSHSSDGRLKRKFVIITMSIGVVVLSVLLTSMVVGLWVGTGQIHLGRLDLGPEWSSSFAPSITPTTISSGINWEMGPVTTEEASLPSPPTTRGVDGGNDGEGEDGSKSIL
ncbi:hypothetical protein BDP27DRAFT_1419429 [Rhodocollybia butyracea]|uniref:Uncharacterized protein n=1 Tax=Rhodocollybia butyracea TaxID=206335 RepID=A0A9P5PY00_9AGAR|nr:hypothetical protein BDP27DRAFT_1419429 [Rhodocollybia butyracea]